jgi:lipopolysaccharide export system permease protein
MKLLDRYLIKGFLKPFAACLLIFCILVILGRFFDKMGIFTAYHAHVRDIAAFLLLGLPLWLNMVLPVATLLALLFALGQHQQQGEITAFRSAGIPNSRLYAPYFNVGIVLVLISLVGGLTFLPAINYKARAIYRVRIKGEQLGKYRRDHVVAAGRHHRRFTIGWLDAEKSEMKDVVMDTFDVNTHLIETVSASRASYQAGQWTFYDVKQIKYDPANPGWFQETDFKEAPIAIEESPRDFALQDKEPEDMTAKEIIGRIKRLRELGVPISREQVALQMKIALPFAHLIVIAIGIPFALASRNKSRIQTFGYALVVVFMYWGLSSAFQSFGEQGHIPAWIAGWTANFLFTGLAYGLLRRVQ